ncbi:MAG: SDR family NAD(P)-dependent oxidoreductase [Pseudomonadota bacterium]
MSALIIGAGSGLSAWLARALSARGPVHLVARNGARLAEVARETGATIHLADATDENAITDIIEGLEGRLDVAIYNPSARLRGPISELDPAKVRAAIDVTAFGGFLMGQRAARRMLAQDGAHKGTIIFTGASAGEKGFALSAPFAMGKFAQRGLAQSMARELHPKGIHVAWVNIDGAIARGNHAPSQADAQLNPQAIAQSYLHLIDQPKSAWTNELALRPWVETF